MEYFDKDGKRIHIYGIINYEYEILIGSYIEISKEQLEKEMTEAYRITKLYNNEYDIMLYGKPLIDITEKDFLESLDIDTLYSKKHTEIYDQLEKKYPLQEREFIYRLKCKFGVWEIQSEVSINKLL